MFRPSESSIFLEVSFYFVYILYANWALTRLRDAYVNLKPKKLYTL